MEVLPNVNVKENIYEMNMNVFWNLAPRSLIEDYQNFRSVWYLHHQSSLMMEA
jgi:hypothetical protein